MLSFSCLHNGLYKPTKSLAIFSSNCLQHREDNPLMAELLFVTKIFKKHSCLKDEAKRCTISKSNYWNK